MTDARADARESLLHVLAASAVTVALWFVPFAGLAVYPIRLLVTYVHEIGHALGTLLTLGLPVEIEIYADTSGLTLSLGGLRLLVLASGYVGAPIIGGAMLLLAARRRGVRPALVTAGLGLLVSTVLLAGNLLTWATGVLFGLFFLGLALWAHPKAGRFLLSFLAIQCMLGALFDLGTLFWASALPSGLVSDAHLMAAETGGWVPAIVWATLYVGLGLAALAVTLSVYYNLTVDHIVGQDSI